LEESPCAHRGKRVQREHGAQYDAHRDGHLAKYGQSQTTLRVRDVCRASRALILQQKTSRPVQFEITEPARTAVAAWIAYSK
jgi:hypothetical protein